VALFSRWALFVGSTAFVGSDFPPLRGSRAIRLFDAYRVTRQTPAARVSFQQDQSKGGIGRVVPVRFRVAVARS
jgi:hypothetical protein